MGSDPAPFLANLFLYFYESKWITTTKKHDIHKARRFGNVFQFIDDLVAINDNGEFEKCYSDIYPPELELKKENIRYTEGKFLDLMINIRDDKFVISLYDKHNTFPFSIVRMPYLESNIPSKMFYSAFGSEILRFARNTSNFKRLVILRLAGAISGADDAYSSGTPGLNADKVAQHGAG